MILDFVDERAVVTYPEQEKTLVALRDKIPKKPEWSANSSVDWDLWHERERDSLTPAEWQEHRRLERLHRAASVPSVEIDLRSLLTMRRRDEFPLWTMASPFDEVSVTNGGVIDASHGIVRKTVDFSYLVHNADGIPPHGGFLGSVGSRLLSVSSFSCVTGAIQDIDRKDRLKFTIQPSGGFPALPAKIRKLADELKTCAHCVAILYQPLAWQKVPYSPPSPDPALLVRHDDRSPFRCVAVWGHDGASIREFTFDS